MDYYLHLAIVFSIYGILGVSLNLVVGYTGLLSVTHAAFYGIGAYSTAILLTRTDVGFFLSIPLAMVIAAAISLGIGVVLSRFSDDYYALGSFGFNVIIVSVLLNWSDLTKGPLGIPGIPRPELLGVDLTGARFLLLALLCLAAVYGLSHLIVTSSFGRVLKAIREDQDAIQVFGYNVLWFKLTIFVASAAMAAVAGSLLATYLTYIDPSSFSLLESVFILAIIILGGLSSLNGAVLGAAALVLLPELLRFVGFPAEIAGQMRQLVYGLLLIVLMVYRPQGLVGEYKI
jgi:branched-chain amino acid transport system permease protein